MKPLEKIGLLPRILLAMTAGVLCSTFLPLAVARFFATFNEIFGHFLSFSIPLIVLGLVAPGIAELGTGAGRLLGISALLAYASTLAAGFFSYFVCRWSYPALLDATSGINPVEAAERTPFDPYFSIDMPPLMSVTSALLLAFVLGLGLAGGKNSGLKGALVEFRAVVSALIGRAIVPLLPLYILSLIHI